MKNENPLNYVILDEEKPVNYRELIEKYTYHWKWFILAILMALAAAFVYLRYTPQCKKGDQLSARHSNI